MTAIPRSASYVPSEWGKKFHSRREEEVFGAGAAGPGKALSLDTVVPTPRGMALLSDLRPGDEVFGITGKRVRVVAETAVQHSRPCFELVVHEQTIVADAAHEWVTLASELHPLKTTEQIANSVFATSIPAAGVADFGPAKPLQLDPYVLGVCLVMGQPKDRSKFTGWDLELYANMQLIGYTLDEAGYRVSQIRERRDVINALIPESGRRIPPSYLAGSFNQRMALVEGIMDGAGGTGPTVGENDLPFLADFLALAASCGLGPRIVRGYRKTHGRGWYVYIQSRHHRCSRRTAGKPHKRDERQRYEVTRITRVPSVPVKCIQVEGGTYCITPAYIPTHNSMVLLTDPLEQVWVEHIRCQQDKIPDAFPEDIKAAIKENPLRWGYSEGWALHLRRTLTRLGETIERAHRMFPLIDPDVDWNEKKSTFTFSSGFKYQFGHCKDRNDHNNYLGQQYCVAQGTRVLMGDGSLRAVETVEAGERVMTLEGPKRVAALWRTGVRACVRATTEYRGVTFGTQVHPTTHPVLLWPTAGSDSQSSSGHSCSDSLGPGPFQTWQDFESLLDGAPRSPGTRASRVTEDSGFVTSDGLRLALERLPPLSVPVVLSEHVLRMIPLLAVGGGIGVLTDLGTTIDSPVDCSSSGYPHGGPPRFPSGCDQSRAPLQGDAAESSPCPTPDAPGGIQAHTPGNPASFYAHFYTGESRALTGDVRMGTATLEYAGWHPTWDLTVEDANHYITETGLVNCNTHLGFDELIEFNKDQYDFICSRNRTGDRVLRLMLKKRSASNPKLTKAKGEDIQLDDPGWVKKYFVDPAPKGNVILRKKVVLKSGEVVYHRRLYLPATLYDNPDPDFVRQYEIELRTKPKHIQEAYLFGRWDSVIGSFFEDAWNPDVHICRPFKIPQHWPVFRALDWGYQTEGCLGYYALDKEQDILYKFWECVFKKKPVTYFVDTILKPFEVANKLWSPFGGSLVYGPADTQIWEERGESAKSKYQEFVTAGVDWCYADKKSRADNAQRVHERLMGHENFTRPPRLILFANCASTRQVLPAMQTNPNDATEPAKGGFDHPYDETSYACAYAHGRILEAPNYKGRVVEKDDEEPEDASRGSFGYWQG